MLEIYGIYFNGYKSFSVKNYAQIQQIKHINVLIGKNNCGKSSVIDIIHYILDIDQYSQNISRINDIELIFKLDEEHIKQVFSESSSGGIIGNQYRRHYDFGKKFIDELFRTKLEINKTNYGTKKSTFNYGYSPNQTEIFENKYIDFWNKLSLSLSNTYSKYFNEYKFRRLNAERDIVPESETENEELSSNGSGASNIIRKFINFSLYNEKLIEVKLLAQLNTIMNPEANFTSIRVQQVQKADELLWEIFLEEKDAGRFALSQSGSGLKTIILILLNLLIIPETSAYKDKKIVYAFEEIENNLHPALQRKIFDYLYKFATDNDICIFLTTHSHVAINTYYDKEHTNIYHVIKENNASTIKIIENHLDKTQILDDLDVRASDLLQSNGIIWVEGPSDRIYTKRWLEVFCNDNFKEGEHYQFLYYGGRLLSHYTTETEAKNLINVLLTNRNAAIIIDSDKRHKNSNINDTKKRIAEEFNKNKCFCWITKGKEIENYLSFKDISNCFGYELTRACGQYELFPDYIKEINKPFVKVDFARKIAPYITKENSDDIHDLKKQITQLYNKIGIWNKK